MEKEYKEYLIQGQITEVKKSLFNFEGPNPKRYGGIAQLGEHLLCKQGVNGSIPFISTTFFLLKKKEGKENFT